MTTFAAPSFLPMVFETSTGTTGTTGTDEDHNMLIDSELNIILNGDADHNFAGSFSSLDTTDHSNMATYMDNLTTPIPNPLKALIGSHATMVGHLDTVLHSPVPNPLATSVPDPLLGSSSMSMAALSQDNDHNNHYHSFGSVSPAASCAEISDCSEEDLNSIDPTPLSQMCDELVFFRESSASPPPQEVTSSSITSVSASAISVVQLLPLPASPSPVHKRKAPLSSVAVTKTSRTQQASSPTNKKRRVGKASMMHSVVAGSSYNASTSHLQQHQQWETKGDNPEEETKRRNREHARKSRLRRKSVTLVLQQSLEELKQENQKLRGCVQSSFGKTITDELVDQRLATRSDRFIDMLRDRSNTCLGGKSLSFLQNLRKDIPSVVLFVRND